MFFAIRVDKRLYLSGASRASPKMERCDKTCKLENIAA